MTRLLTILGLCLAFVGTTTTAEARHRHHGHHHYRHHAQHSHSIRPQGFSFDFFQGFKQSTFTSEFHEVVGHARIVGGRPRGCPHRYCGCGVSLKTFGRIIPELNLAANWGRKFRPTNKRSDVVAWKNGHVVYVMHPTRGTKYMVYDPNSGHGRIRVHERDLRRFRFVDYHSPRGA